MSRRAGREHRPAVFVRDASGRAERRASPEEVALALRDAARAMENGRHGWPEIALAIAAEASRLGLHPRTMAAPRPTLRGIGASMARTPPAVLSAARLTDEWLAIARAMLRDANESRAMQDSLFHEARTRKEQGRT